MRSSRPLMGDNGSTHLLSDVYYIQVHLSFRESWPRVTPCAIKTDCGPNLYKRRVTSVGYQTGYKGSVHRRMVMGKALLQQE